MLATDGAVSFLEKLAPAIEQADLSGGIGSAVNCAIETLRPFAKGPTSNAQCARNGWSTFGNALQRTTRLTSNVPIVLGRAVQDARDCIKVGELPGANVDGDVRPLRTHWGIWIF